MHLVIDSQPHHVPPSTPVRTESAAARLLASGELGAHLLRLAEAAAEEHVAHEAHIAPTVHSRCRQGSNGGGA